MKHEPIKADCLQLPWIDRALSYLLAVTLLAGLVVLIKF